MLVEVEVQVEVEEATITARIKSETGPCARISQQVWCATPKRPPLAKAVQGLEPDDRNRFGVLPDLVQLSLPSSLSRRSAQLKATKRRQSRSGRGNEARLFG